MAVFMKSTQDVPSDQQHFLHVVAPSGRSIEPCVFLVAQGIADQAVSYAGKFLDDSCVAVNLLEEAAASVSEVIRTKEAAQIAPIRDVRRYLFRVFLRKVAEVGETRPDTKRPANGIPIPAMIARATGWIARYFWTRFWAISTALRER